MKNTLITLASVATLAVTANAQVSLQNPNTIGSDAGSIKKLSTGETWKWTYSGNDTVADNNSNIFTAGGTSNYTLSFDNPFDLADLNHINLMTDFDITSAITGQLSISGGTATLASIVNSADGTYNSADGTWALTVPAGETNADLAWKIDGSTGTFTSLTVTTSGSQAGDGLGSTFITTADFAVVPEPSSTALLGLGGLALILRRRK